MSVSGEVYAQSQELLTGKVREVVEEIDLAESESVKLLVRDAASPVKLMSASPRISQFLGNGADVSVQGYYLSSGKFLVEGAEALPAIRSLPSSPVGGGTRSLVFIRIHFTDNSPGCDADYLRDLMWDDSDSVNEYFNKLSEGNLNFERDADGDGNPDIIDVHLPVSWPIQSEFDRYALAYQAKVKLYNEGTNLDVLFDHEVYVFPMYTYFGGVASPNCDLDECTVWLNGGCLPKTLLIHELGHNIGLNHSRGDLDNDGYVSDSDPSCPMSTYSANSWTHFRHFNAAHKSILGWIPASEHQVITEEGDYVVGSVELKASEASPIPPTNVRVLKMYFDLQPGSNGGDRHYYLSYRNNLDEFSAHLPDNLDKVSIHYTAETIYTETVFLGSYGPGEKWYDNRSEGISVEVLSTDGTSATVRVKFEDYPPVSTPTPTATVTPTPSPNPEPTSTATPLPSPVSTPEGEEEAATPTPSLTPLDANLVTFKMKHRWNRKGRAFSLSGKLLSNGLPLVNEEVTLYIGSSRKARKASFLVENSTSILTSNTNTKGRFSFSGLRLTGVYRAYTRGVWSNVRAVRKATSFK